MRRLGIAAALFGVSAFAIPQYGVWVRTLNGKALLREAEFTRKVAVLEAQAKKDSAAQLAEAEIIRAEGVSKANKIIGESLKTIRDTSSTSGSPKARTTATEPCT